MLQWEQAIKMLIPIAAKMRPNKGSMTHGVSQDDLVSVALTQLVKVFEYDKTSVNCNPAQLTIVGRNAMLAEILRMRPGKRAKVHDYELVFVGEEGAAYDIPDYDYESPEHLTMLKATIATLLEGLPIIRRRILLYQLQGYNQRETREALEVTQSFVDRTMAAFRSHYKYRCDLCTLPAFQLHCRIICPFCGYQSDAID